MAPGFFGILEEERDGRSPLTRFADAAAYFWCLTPMEVLQDIRSHDGSRQFASLPATRDWYEVRDHTILLFGAELTGFVCDGVTESWIEFTCFGESFTINDQFGAYWFFVKNALCNQEHLLVVKARWASLLGGGV